MKGIEEIKAGEPGYDLACHIQTLDSLIDGEPDDDGLGSMLQPIRDDLAKALRALLATQEAIEADADDEEVPYDLARDSVAEVLGVTA